MDKNDNLSIENYFVSNEFVNSISSLNELFNNDKVDSKELVGYIVGASLKYYMLLDGINKFSVDGMNQFTTKLSNYISQNNIVNFHSRELKEYVNSELLNDFLQVLGVPQERLKEEIINSKVKDLIVASLEKKDYMFHGFNGYYLNSIKENGINPNVKENQEDILMINEIFEKHGIKMGLGWAMHDTGKVSFSKTPSVSYDYAERSPEWFSQFAGGSTNYFNNRNAFLDNDYERARLNLINLMTDKGFTQDDLQIVINFFNQNWQKYANQNPMIVMVENNNPLDYIKDSINFEKGINSDYSQLFHVHFYDEAIDCKSSQKIDTTNAKFIELPKHNELIKRIKLNNENNKLL